MKLILVNIRLASGMFQVQRGCVFHREQFLS